jgi:hypothetical protein
VKWVWKLFPFLNPGAAPQSQGKKMKYHFDHEAALLRHGARLCRECGGEGVLDISQGPPWCAEIIRECPVCHGRGLHLDELQTYRRVRTTMPTVPIPKFDICMICKRPLELEMERDEGMCVECQCDAAYCCQGSK